MLKHKFALGLLAIVFSLANVSNAQQPKGGKKISTDLFGLFFEDINYAADGGLYADVRLNTPHRLCR